MLPPVHPVMRFDHCFAILGVMDVICWEWGPMKEKLCQVIYTQTGMGVTRCLPRDGILQVSCKTVG